MDKKFKNIIRHIKLLYHFTRLSYQALMEYRLNFIMGFVVESSYFLIKLTYLLVVIRTGVKIGGLDPNTVSIFIGTYCVMTGVWMMLGGVNSIPSKIRSGDLDLLITKPVSLQFIQSFCFIDIAMALPNMGFGTLLICIGWAKSGIPVNFMNIFGFILFMLSGAVLTYGICMLPAIAAFWLVSTGGISTVFSALWDFNNMPMLMYQRIIQRIGVFVIPIFLITNWPGLYAMGELSPLMILWGILVPVIFLVISRYFWLRGLRRYTSTGG